MQKIVIVFFIICCSLLLCFNSAEARRFGGGKSFGMQRTIPSRSFSQAAASNIGHQAISPLKKWLGPLAGIAAGSLLAYFMMSHGLGSGLLAWLAVGVLIMFILQFIKNKNKQNNFQEAMPANSTLVKNDYSYQTSSSAGSVATPNNFNESEFLREMKSQFLRLQAAYDQKNLADIREFTTPEVFSEIQLQIQERGIAENKTNVINLNARLLDFSEEFQIPVASVEFNGLIEESPKIEPISFLETWHFRKDVISQRWFVAGIEQQSS